MTKPQILVIKHGALGDLIQAMGPFASIRQRHPDAEITLLTTPPYRDLCAASGYFDNILLDTRPKWWQVRPWWQLSKQLRSTHYNWVYDLQTSERTACYFRVIPHGNWSGIAKGCSHPDNPERDKLHTLERQAGQLELAGITEVLAPNLDWVEADLSRLNLPKKMVLCFPGGSAHRSVKRWPVEQFVALGQHLLDIGITPVFDGGKAELAALTQIQQALPAARVLVGETNMLELVVMTRHAMAAVGGDTGPMHIAAVVGCPCLVLFSSASDPKRCRQRGRKVEILRRDKLSDLSLGEVTTALDKFFRIS